MKIKKKYENQEKWSENQEKLYENQEIWKENKVKDLKIKNRRGFDRRKTTFQIYE